MANVDGLARAIKKELSLLPTMAQEIADQIGNEMASEAVRDLKRISPKDRGEYDKAWRKKAEPSPSGGKLFRVYNKDYPWLTHLLEYGHIIAATGGRTRAIPHISVVDKRINEEYPARVTEGINNANR